MTYEIISPLGPRNGDGTFDTFFDLEKYKNQDEAKSSNDLVVINFVKNEGGLIFFEGYHSKVPDRKLYRQLNYQHFPFGIDISDDNLAQELADNLFKSIQ